jgi:hypothetical protein
VPTSWAELREAAIAAHDRRPLRHRRGRRQPWRPLHLHNTILNNGGGLFTPEAELALLSDPKNREGLEALSRWRRTDSIHPASPGYTNVDTDRALPSGPGVEGAGDPHFVDRAPELADKIGVCRR